MTRHRSRRELERRLDDLEPTGPDRQIHIVGPEGGDGDYLTPSEFEERYGHPPDESNGVIIRYPAEAEQY